MEHEKSRLTPVNESSHLRPVEIDVVREGEAKHADCCSSQHLSPVSENIDYSIRRTIECEKCGMQFGLKELNLSRGRCPYCKEVVPLSEYCQHIPEKRFWAVYSNIPVWSKVLVVLFGSLVIAKVFGAVIDLCYQYRAVGLGDLGAWNYFCNVWFIQDVVVALVLYYLMDLCLRLGRRDKDELVAFRIAKKSGADTTFLTKSRQRESTFAITIFVIAAIVVSAVFGVYRINDNQRAQREHETVNQAVEIYRQKSRQINEALFDKDIVEFIANPVDYVQAKGDIQRTRKLFVRMTRLLESGVDACVELLEYGQRFHNVYGFSETFQSASIEKMDWELWYVLFRHCRILLSHFEEWNKGDPLGILKDEFKIEDMQVIRRKLNEGLLVYDEAIGKIQEFELQAKINRNDIVFRKISEQLSALEKEAADRKAKAEAERIAEENRKAKEEALRLAAEKAAAEAERKRQQIELARQEEARRLAREAAGKVIELFKRGEWRTGLAKAENVSKSDPELMFWTGICYELGLGDDCDAAKAVELYRMAAEQGQIDALLEMGRRYEAGDGVLPDAEKARRSRKAASRQGGKTAGYDYLLRLRAQRREEQEAAARKVREAIAAKEADKKLQELKQEVERLRENAKSSNEDAANTAAQLTSMRAVPTSDPTRPRFDGAPTLSLLKFTKRNARAKDWYKKACATAEMGAENKNKVKDQYNLGRSLGGPRWPELEAWLDHWK